MSAALCLPIFMLYDFIGAAISSALLGIQPVVVIILVFIILKSNHKN